MVGPERGVFPKTAKGVVDRQVEFLDGCGRVPRDIDGNIAERCEWATSASGKGNDEDIQRTCRRGGVEEVGRISGGRQAEKGVAGLAEAEDELREAIVRGAVVSPCGQEGGQVR